MVIQWSNFAKTNLKDFIHYSKISNPNIYVQKLIFNVSILEDNPKAGKVITHKNTVEIRQLVYKMHRILYHIYEDEIHIDAVLHSHFNLNNYLKK